MLRTVSKNLLRTAVKISTPKVAFVRVQAFTSAQGPRQAEKKDDAADDEEAKTIQSDKDFQVGRRKDEMDAKEEGIDLYNSEPIIPAGDAGTRENPIMVPSGMQERAIGYEDPNTHQLVWFNLNKGNLHYIPDIGLYFKMQPV
mmetsp:Transcript_11267/g.10897  ORF Transcript_11267/g.10897 Transcript_11267/m.10897 type:complete len:143 (+) Transcript_11267:76-504(+)|eukprot:CAMPEP_0119039826 /NCGR_PEP_ID=MMETSP1177-20130426/9518_1 /TAXON_ID=2985 /ORGANISM="Ochromonas sp, Strain CCMP1899" /LENGTH=142 /DNA_ID=CAMNT_0007004195 /DNA_START=62 /DNA_END=490 /DNA_ORIENTATION=+